MLDFSRTHLFSKRAYAFLTGDIQGENEAHDEVFMGDTLIPATPPGVGVFRNSGALASFLSFFFFSFCLFLF